MVGPDGRSKPWNFTPSARIMKIKLNNESIAVVRKDLAADYQALADQHSEEVVHILEEYVTTQLEIICQIQENEVDRQATGRQSVETVELPDNPLEEAAPKPQEEVVAATSTPPISEPATKETPEPAPIPVPHAMPPTTPLPTTTAPPQPESCPTPTTELPAQPDLTTEPTTTPLAEPAWDRSA